MEIEVGKYYKRRDGLKAGPVDFNHKIGAATYPFVAPVDYVTNDKKIVHLSYSEDGKFDVNAVQNQADLIEEWQDPVAETEPEATAARDMLSHPYYPLQKVLDEAHFQASQGKGRERHANDRDFIDQPIMEIGRMCGPGFNTGQAMKKIQEAMGMLSRGQDDAAIRELLGAINYTASAVILIRERPPLVKVTS